MADKNYAKYPPMSVPIVAPDAIGSLKYDYVVIAIRVAIAYNEIKRILLEQHVPEERIICIFERTNLPGIWREGSNYQSVLSLNEKKRSIAFLIVGGRGDYIIQKRFLMEIVKLVPDCKIFLYSIRYTDYLKYLYSDCSNICAVYESGRSEKI